jgi:hypothetical protein
VRTQFSWTHYKMLSSLGDNAKFHLAKATKNN